MNSVVQQAAGFDGEVSGLSLTDLLQIKAMGRFTGRIVVEHGGRSGYLFFRDGDLIHAQLDSLEGKEAFGRILAWGGGTFRAESKVTTTQQTIHENVQYLLLDALRQQDEAAAGREGESTTATQATKEGGGMKERLSGIAGLQDVVLTDRDGGVMQTIGANGDGLTAQGMYLVSTSGQIADELGLGSFKGAVIQGARAHLICLEGPKNYLFAGVQGEAKPSAVEAEVRRALSNQG